MDLDTATKRIRAAADARRDPNFLIMARTDIRATDGLQAAKDRAKHSWTRELTPSSPEAMKDLAEFQAIRDAVDVPILANMTEFGKSDLFTADQLHGVGVNMVIYPVTLLRSAMGAAERVLDTLKSLGTQHVRVPEMLTRARLYDLVDYEAYNKFDSGIFNFQIPPHAQILRTATKEFSMADTEIKKGLAGVVVDYTAVSKVNPDTNSLLYRGGTRCRNWLLTAASRRSPTCSGTANCPTPTNWPPSQRRNVPAAPWTPAVKQMVDALPLTAHPMDICRTAASVMRPPPVGGGLIPRSQPDKGNRPVRRHARRRRLRQRRRRGQNLVEPRSDLGYSANFLWMTFGEDAADEVIEAFNVSMILYAEHSFNASTFTARVVTSTLSDLHSAVTGAIGGALKVPCTEAPMKPSCTPSMRSAYAPPRNPWRRQLPAPGGWMDHALANKKKVMASGTGSTSTVTPACPP